MYQYFSINIIVSLFALFYISQFKTAPARVSFIFIFIALLSWLVPYDLLSSYLASDNNTSFLPQLDAFRQTVKSHIVLQASDETAVTLKQLFIILSSLGIIVFILDLVLLNKKMNSLKLQYYKKIDSVNVYTSTYIKSPFCIGIFNPKICINSELIGAVEFESVLQHELQHIKQHDTWFISVITFIQRVLWWNPVVLLLIKKARIFLELSCDEKTAKKIGKAQYQKDLAILLVQENQKNQSKLSLSYFSDKNMNLLRIKQLNKEIKMNKKHKYLIFSTAVVPIIISLLISSQSISANIDSNDKTQKEVTLKANQVQIVFDSNVFYNTEYADELDEKGKKIISQQDHKSIETNIVATLNEIRKFSFGKEKEEVSFTISQIKNEQYMIDFDITYFIDGQKINLKPSMLVLKGEAASLRSEEDNYRFELNIKII